MAPRTTEIRDVRALAQKLFGQCRDSTSSYHSLTGGIRKLRNVLEEVEESLEESQSVQPGEDRLHDMVATSKQALESLDLSLQHHRCSPSSRQRISGSTVADFQTHLEATTHNLRIAFDFMDRTSEIELKVNTLDGSWTQSPRLQSATTSASSVEHSCKLSHASSTWSLVNRDSQDQSVATDPTNLHTEPSIEVMPSNEKEVSWVESTSLGVPDADQARRALSLSADWRMPFATPDLLSIPFKDATAMLLRDDDGTPLFSERPHSSTTSAVLPSPSAAMKIDSSRSATVTGEDCVPPEIDAQAEYSDANNKKVEALLAVHVDKDSEQERTKRQDGVPSQKLQDDVAPGAFKQYISHASPVSRLSMGRVFPELADTAKHTPAVAKAEYKPKKEESPRATTGDKSQSFIQYTLQDINVKEDQTCQHQSQPESTPGIHNLTTSSSAWSKMPSRPPPPLPKPRRAKSQPKSAPTEVSAVESMANQLESVEPVNEELKITDVETVLPWRRASASTNSHQNKPRKLKLPMDGRTYAVTNASSKDRPSSGASYDSLYDTSPQTTTSDLRPPPLAPHKKTRSIPDINIDGSALGQVDPVQAAGLRERPRSYTAPSTADAATDAAQISNKSRFRENRRPIVPDRPPRCDFERSTPTATRTGSATVLPVSHAANDVSEVDRRRLNVSSKPLYVSARKSVDEVLIVEDSGESLSQILSISRIELLDKSTTSQVSGSSSSEEENGQPKNVSGVIEYFGHDAGPTLDAVPAPVLEAGYELDRDRKQIIISLWNNSHWDQAEAYLLGHLESLLARGDVASARRIRHLLGVCASYRGKWHDSIAIFLSVLRTPVQNIDDLDDGDCAACWWLGDAYAMLNLRLEALLAYSMAERSSLFRDSTQPRLQMCISAEQECCQLGSSMADFKLRWAQKAMDGDSIAGDSILNTKIVTEAAAKLLLANEPRKAYRESLQGLSHDMSRAAQLYSLLTAPVIPPFQWYQRLKLVSDFFEPDRPWPMLYDPLFAMANVQRGRLLLYECDLLQVFSSNVDAKLPKSGPVGLSRMDCFSSNDLLWLIRTIRECLRTYEMEWSEVANVQGTWFVARYSFMQDKRIATTFYFSIALFRQSFRSGYGAEIAPDGIYSARMVHTDIDYERGVHVSEPKRIKKLIREYLDVAAKLRPKSSKRDSSPSVLKPRPNATKGQTSVGSDSPPLPPRPRLM